MCSRPYIYPHFCLCKENSSGGGDRASGSIAYGNE